MWFFNLLCLSVMLIGVVTAANFYIRNQFSFWKKRGVPFREPHWLFGNFADHVMGKISLADLSLDLYNEFKNERFGGIWRFFTPVLWVMDPLLIRDILIKDFGTWSTRGFIVNEDTDPLNKNLTNMEGKRWKTMRAKMTPTFTSGKLKQMHQHLIDSGDAFEQYLNELVASGGLVEAGNMSAKFTIEVIGSCVFGIKMNSLNDDNSVFRDMWKKIFIQSTREKIVRTVQSDFTLLFKLLKLPIFTQELSTFFLNITKENFDYREKNNVHKHDFIDLLRDLRNKIEPLEEEEVEYDDTLLAAQAFVFFAAGTGLSAIAISFCLHELAYHQDIQDRLREEVHRTKAASGGEITWESMKTMKYLDMVFQEAHRKYPPVMNVVRTSVKPYRIPGTNVDLPSGTECVIPIYAIHHDPTYYPNPEKFDPERFREEVKNQRPPFTFIPFGGGPRACIGLRFAELETKLALVKLVDKFKISPSEKSQNPLQLDPSERFLGSKGGIWVRISKNSST